MGRWGQLWGQQGQDRQRKTGAGSWERQYKAVQGSTRQCEAVQGSDLPTGAGGRKRRENSAKQCFESNPTYGHHSKHLSPDGQHLRVVIRVPGTHLGSNCLNRVIELNSLESVLLLQQPQRLHKLQRVSAQV